MLRTFSIYSSTMCRQLGSYCIVSLFKSGPTAAISYFVASSLSMQAISCSYRRIAKELLRSLRPPDTAELCDETMSIRLWVGLVGDIMALF